VEGKIADMYTLYKVRFEQLSKSQNEAAASKAEKFYSTGMAEHFGPGKPCFDSIEEKNKISQEAAFKVFVKEPKMGGARAEIREKVRCLFYKQD
jgi:hypothetical protein